ncbi:hypothetical protein Gogos_004000, partial [Gossypium gossypioides]|nr:hypothetical protein [Gossypium gossypioides]
SRICTCTGSFSSTLVSSSKPEATASCQICCGRPLVDGIGSVSSGMMSTVGLELTSFIDPDWTWKTVSKRNRSTTRRSRKLVADSLTFGKGLADKNARTLEDVSVSESEKVGVDVLGRRFSEKVESVPIKKRRFMFQSSSPPPPSTPNLHLEASAQHVDFQPAPDQDSGSGAVQGQQLRKSDCSAKSFVSSIDVEKNSEVINGVDDFSGIEILAAAACGDSICNDVTENEGNPLVEEPTQEKVQFSASSIHLEETTASLEVACSFPKESVNESKSEGSSSQDNSFAVLHEFPSDKDTTPESSVPLPDDRLLWDLNVSMDAWPCDGGNVDSKKASIDDISVRSEELQTKEPHDIKNDATNAVVASDVGGGNKMTSDSRTMPVGTDDSSTEKQESQGCSGYDSQKDSFDNISVGSEESPTKEPQDVKNGTTNEVVSSDVDGTTNEVVSSDVDGTTNEVVSSDVGGGNRMTSDIRTVPVETDDLSTEKQESQGCSSYDSPKDSFDTISVRSEELQAKEPQDIKDDNTNDVVSPDVDGGNRMTSDLRTLPVETDDLNGEKQDTEGCSGYDSQFEDGELRESDVQCWEEAEQVDYDTEFEEERSFGLEAESGEQELKVERGSNPELTGSFKCYEAGESLRKNSVSLKIGTVEVSDGETMKIDCLDRSNYDLRVDLSKVSKREILSCVEGSLSTDVVQRSRFDNFNGLYPRAERGSGSDRFVGCDGSSSHMRVRSPGGAHFFNPSANYRDSKRQDPSIYHGPYGFGRPRPKSAFDNREYPMGADQAPSEAAGVPRTDHRITRQFTGSNRSLLRRRSPIERADSYGMFPRMPNVRDTSPDRNRFRRYQQGVSRGIRDQYLRHIPDDSSRYESRMPHCIDRRERSISPHGGRPHHTVPYKRARSRSRSRSPIDWLLHRDRNEGSRRRNRSPDFRSDARIDRVRLPFAKRFAAGYGEFISSPRSRVSPQRNSKIFEDRSNPGLDHFRERKSHMRMIQQDQRFDQVRPFRRLNSHDYFNPMIRPRRFPDRTTGGKGCKYETSDDGKHSSRYPMIHRVRCYDTEGGARRFRYNEEDSYMAKNSLTVTNSTGVSSRRPDDADAPRTASDDR